MITLHFVILLLCAIPCRASQAGPQYTYPVAAYKAEGVPHFLIINQWSSDKLELCDWNSKTGQMNKLLMACYTPANVTMLPDSSGFSFVDNGRIRIKRFQKRAVRTLEIYEPVYGIEVIRWLNAQTCYFHALSDGRCGIYSLTLDEELTPLFVQPDIDFLYPFIVQDTLFFIERKNVGCRHTYAVGTKPLMQPGSNMQTLVHFGVKPLYLLEMTSPEQGFVVECDKEGSLCTFYHYLLLKKGLYWQKELLYTFRVPQNLFDHYAGGLYESFLPLKPRFEGEYIYFSSYNEFAGGLSLYRFTLKTRSIERIAEKSNYHLFPPLFIDSEGWGGGSLAALLKVL